MRTRSFPTPSFRPFRMTRAFSLFGQIAFARVGSWLWATLLLRASLTETG
jgi:hypothetical protein